MLKLRTDIPYVKPDGKLTQAGVEAIQGQIDGVDSSIGARVAAIEAELAGSLINLQAAIAASGQTEIDFTGVPAWVNRITVLFSGLSTNGSSLVQVQIGDSGGVETTGYLGTSTNIAAAALATGPLSAGFLLDFGAGAAAANLRHGALTLSRVTGDTWACTGHVSLSDTSRSTIVAGTKTLSGTLDRVRVTTEIGTQTFDAGSVSISWE